MKYLKTIYSLYFPEVRKKLEELWEKKPHYLFDDNFNANQEGKEIEFINKWLKWIDTSVYIKSEEFSHRYATSGSSEAIREFIHNCSIKNKRLILFDSDYEGYKAFSEASSCRYLIVNRDEWDKVQYKSDDVVILSNPSSIDGCYWADYENFCSYLENNHPSVEIALDLCYVGICVNNSQINCGYKNITTIFFSLSKIFGVYFHRIGGVISKNELLGLVGNKWFKNMFSLEFGIILMESFQPNQLAVKYSKYKKEIEEQIEEDLNIKIKKNDVLILSSSDQYSEAFSRGNKTRICITPELFNKIKKDFNENY